MNLARDSVNLKTALIAACLFLCACLPARATTLDEVRGIKLSYAVYVGGLHIMNSTTEFTRKGPVYHIEMKAGTQGFIRRLAPWDADLTSTGRMEKDQVKPKQGAVVTNWQKDPKKIIFDYKDNAPIEARFDPPQGDDHEPVPEAMKRDVLDPLSGIVQMMASFAYGSGCTQTVPIFDGHRRFDLTLEDKGEEKLEGGDYSVFTGLAAKCQADFTMRAGSRKDREGSRFWEAMKGKNGNPQPVYVYLGKVREDLPELPVRAVTDTVFGGVVIHLTDISGVKIKSAALE
jgi:hypothetical protein